MKSAIRNKITFVVVLIGMAILANFKSGASVETRIAGKGLEGLGIAVDGPTANVATKIGSTSFQANWTAIKGVDGYKLYVYTVGKGLTKTYVSGYNPKAVAGATTVSASISGLEMGTTYYYVLTAVSGRNETDLSNVISLKTLETAPEAPLATAATDVWTTSFQANWKPSEGATAYELTIITGTPGVIGLHEPIAGYDGKEVSDTSVVLPANTLLPGVNYYYYVVAVNSVGNSVNSNNIEVKTLVNTFEAHAATNITINSFQAHWDIVEGATGYKVAVWDFYTDDYVEGIEAVSGGATSTCTISGLNPGRDYRYFVTGFIDDASFCSSTNQSFSTLSYKSLILSANPVEGGVVSGGETVGAGDPVTAQATPNEGYIFVNWTKDGTEVSTNTSYTFNLDENTELVANFEAGVVPLAAPENLETTQIVDNSFVAKWDLVSGATEYKLSVYTKNAEGDKVYLDDYNPAIGGVTTRKALVEGLNPNTTYYWYVQAANSSQTSEESATQTVKTKYTGTSILEVTDITSTSCLASWSPVAGALEYKLWLLNESDEYIDGFGAKSVSETSFLIEGLSPNGDYYIAVSVVYIDGESAKSPNWKITTSRYTLVLSASPEIGGVVSAHNDVDNPDNTIAQAVANDGYVFVNWTESGVEVSTNASYSFPFNEDRTLLANFTTSITSNTLSLSATPAEGGTVSGAATINTGNSVTAQATANDGYTFVNWTEGGTEVSTNASYTFTLNEDRTLVANFANVVSSNTLSLSATPAEGGTFSGAATVNAGTSVTAEAIANAGYAFVNWTEDGTEVSTEASYTFALNADKTLVANFRLTTGIDDRIGTAIKVWPNPTSTILYISEVPKGATIKLSSVVGKLVLQKEDCKEMETLNVVGLNNGIYVVTIQNDEECYSYKIIKR